MKQLSVQRGVGLVEVLVAMLILSVAILGFIALQVRATVATEEALKRSDALIILNGLAEKIRLNRDGNYQVAWPKERPNCSQTQGCDANQQALVDLYQQQVLAESKLIRLGVDTCPNTSSQQSRLCLLAAWNETEPLIAAQNVQNRCLNDNTAAEHSGKYAGEPSCLVLEAY